MTEAMPRKTRKEKEEAQKKKEMMSSLVFSYSSRPQMKTIETPENMQFTLIRKDIIKTVILGSLFIFFEIGLTLFSKKLGW